MTEPERAALDHIRRVVDSVLGEPLAYGKATAVPPEPVLVSSLPVPYLSQLVGERTVNDSGVVAGAMLVRAYAGIDIKPVDFLNQVGEFNEAPLTLEQVANGLKLNGLMVETRSGLKLADLALVLFSGRPAVTPVHQVILKQDRLSSEESEGPHCLVCVGMDVAYVYVHDPLRRDTTGQNLAIPWLTFYRAWTQAPGSERAALIPRQQLVRRVKVTTETANLLAGPKDGNVLVGTVVLGDVFELSKQQDGWGKIGEGHWINLGDVSDI